MALTFEFAPYTALTTLGTGVGVNWSEFGFDFTPLDPVPGAVAANPTGLGEGSLVLHDTLVMLMNYDFDVSYVFMLSGTEAPAVRACS
jgi:hypothetical protein